MGQGRGSHYVETTIARTWKLSEVYIRDAVEDQQNPKGIFPGGSAGRRRRRPIAAPGCRTCGPTEGGGTGASSRLRQPRYAGRPLRQSPMFTSTIQTLADRALPFGRWKLRCPVYGPANPLRRNDDLGRRPAAQARSEQPRQRFLNRQYLVLAGHFSLGAEVAQERPASGYSRRARSCLWKSQVGNSVNSQL